MTEEKFIVDSPLDKEKAIEKFRECYYDIIESLRKYCDLPDKYYPIVALWILGTYAHRTFDTYPELFINATKGSGKSRLLKLISYLSFNGKVVLDLKEAVLFRTAKNHTICIDEFEKVGHKDSSTLRTLINAAYKKGTAVERMKKVSFKGQEEQIVERFDLFTPVCMANIWGIEDVLSDRCITLILEKSDNKDITLLMEKFENDKKIRSIKDNLVYLVYMLCSVVTSENISEKWNDYVIDRYSGEKQKETTLTTLNTLNTQTTQTTPIVRLNQEQLEIFNKIHDTGLDGRNLELFFPLFIIAKMIGTDIFDNILAIAREITKEKKEEEYAESKDVSLIDFISHQIEWRGNFVSIHDVCQRFKMNTVEDPEEEKWLNPRWLGRALKRSKLIIQKRRVGKGVEVMIDVDKAKTLLKRFKHEEPKTPN